MEWKAASPPPPHYIDIDIDIDIDLGQLLTLTGLQYLPRPDAGTLHDGYGIAFS